MPSLTMGSIAGIRMQGRGSGIRASSKPRDMHALSLYLLHLRLLFLVCLLYPFTSLHFHAFPHLPPLLILVQSARLRLSIRPTFSMADTQGIVGTADLSRIEAPVSWRAYLICGFASFGGLSFPVPERGLMDS